MHKTLLVPLYVALAWPACAGADPFDERFTLTLDRFRSDFDTVVRVDSLEFGQGTQFGFEHDLGLARSDEVTGFEATWRFAERHALSAASFNATRSNTATLNEQIVFGDDIYNVNVVLRARFSAEVAELLYRYALVRTERVRAEVLLGIHQLDLSASLSAAASTDDGEISGDASGKASAGAPLPVLGGALSVALTPRWFFDLEGQALRAKVNDIEGEITDWRAGLRWRALEHLDLGLYYNRFDMNLELERERWTGTLDFHYRGPQLLATLRF